MIYAGLEDYEAYGAGRQWDEIAPLLARASAIVDALTFNRINEFGGLDKLTDFQAKSIRRAVVMQADFLAENADAVNSPFSEYSINGVHMRFGNPTLYTLRDGHAVENVAWALIVGTGLAVRMALPHEVRP